MIRKNRRRKPMGDINVVPYIDVTLVLLIIFMITTPLLQTGVKVDLPQAESATVEQKDEPPVVVSIKKEGQYYIIVGDQDQQQIQPEEIDDRVAAVLANKPETQVLIEADKGIEYGTVVTVMAGLKNAGVPSIGLITRSGDQ
ncbi:Tol-Pal system protein TolR [Candidatus Methylobacter favarea]|uniref:Tol-Pal system protein TolR n=1 Tax=Candidatus Methylobacter favarea TaxID=2707345 RepID=A0A8S0WGQ2_9GAMM|nr:protein TolR [Candidatus Methylobacter favarea]CAA9889329.1 Tol-Pal system protein TolR [Candidatus Methylobacter favarea]